MEKQKSMYISPQIEVIELENEGVIASSVGDFDNVDMKSTRPGVGYSGKNSSSSDLEDMINDILTVED